MENEAELRHAVEQLDHRPGPGKRYPEELRDKLIKPVGARRDAAGTLREIAREVALE